MLRSSVKKLLSRHVCRLESTISSQAPKFNTELLNNTIPTHEQKFNPELLNNLNQVDSTKNIHTAHNGETKMNSDEQLHFEQLAPTWWDSKGSQRILHLMNLQRLDFINDVIQSHKVSLPSTVSGADLYVPKFNIDVFPNEIQKNINNELNAAIYEELGSTGGMTVLDIGCGGGLLSESMARLPFVKSVEGIDMTPGVIEVADRHKTLDPMLQGKLSYELCSLSEKAAQSQYKKYDIVTMFEMLEHVDSPREILSEAWDRVEDNGGILFVSTINRDLISWFTTIFMAEQVLKVVPKGTHHLSKYINCKEIESWFEESFPFEHKILNTKGTMYVPSQGWFTHSCKDIGNYCMAIQKTVVK